jgi:predicted DCC family thiol-disulfide oxidoreductase YuxK
MRPRAPAYPLTVFYDRSCPLCAQEIEGLKALDAAGRLELVDCSAPEFDDEFLIGDGLDRAVLMRRLHARDIRGRWLVGMDAFEAIYRAAGLERVARVWTHPSWRPFFERLYPWVVRNRQLLSRLGAPALLRRLIPKPTGTRSSPRCESCPRP